MNNAGDKLDEDVAKKMKEAMIRAQIDDALVIANFLRTYPYRFTIPEYLSILKENGVKLGKDECVGYLLSCDYIFTQDRETFITYAGAFTGKYFCIKPTAEEVSQGMFVAGARCNPFVDFDSGTSDLIFRYKDRVLPKKVGEFSSGTAVDMFALAGTEFAPQYIAADPANADLELAASGYELPARVGLTGAALDLKAGDRLICSVYDWNEGVVDIKKIEHTSMQMRRSDIRRQSWYSQLEKALLVCFDESGPTNSIRSQLSLVFMNNPSLLIKECGSVMECLAQSKVIALEDYGVESRLWKKGEEVPVVGKWMKGNEEAYQAVLAGFVFVQYFVVDAFIVDQIHRKVNDTQELIETLMLDRMPLKKKELKELALTIEQRHVDLAASYNWFADANVAPVRARALELYIKARRLVLDMVDEAIPLDEYPQQALTVYLQIFANITKTLNMLEGSMMPNSDFSSISNEDVVSTLENMEGDFERAEELLRDEMKKNKPSDTDNSHGFVLIR